MLKKNLFFLVIFYLFVLQVALIGLLFSVPQFYTLAGVNLGALVVLLGLHSFFSKKKDEEIWDKPFVREVSYTEKEEVKDEEKVSESNIENIKIKINRTRTKPVAKGSALYRFLAFLFALVGFWGILFILWDIVDFGAMILWAFCMIIFLLVAFKGANLRNKSFFASVYVLIFLCLGILGVWGLFTPDSVTLREDIKDSITTFIAGLKWNVPEKKTEKPEQDQLSGYVFEETGSVTNVVLSGKESSESLTGDIPTTPVVLTGAQNSAAQSGTTTQTTIQTGTSVQTTTGAQNTVPAVENQNSAKTSSDETAEVTMIEAIKHLIVANAIPLSTSKSVNFTHVAKTSKDYPYMKTALEKKMIWSTTNPYTVLSCDVYIVMRGLAEGRSVAKGDDVKWNYRKVATAKNELNGCQQGAKLTVANL